MFKFIALMILAARPCFAGVDEIMGPPPSATDIKSADSSHLGLNISASYGLGAATYNLSSQGYNVYLPLSLSHLTDISASYQWPRSALLFYLNYFNENVTFSNLTSVSPQSISVSVDQYDALIGYELSAQWEFYAGYRVKVRTATRTTPQDVVSSVYSSGPLAKAQFNIPFDSANKIKVSFTGFFPNYYDETSTSSGFSNSSLNLRLKGTWLKAIKPDFFLGVGLWLEYDFSSFSGTGTRLTTDARESFLKTYIPLTVEVTF